ncbi:MAG: T9SS type A sorting domain-containing protein [Sphingomonadales bacterium]|nr:T9SS type A sorting domain-containing protein [Sphingomonadales bacterium]
MKKLYFLLFAPILSLSAQIEGTWKLAPQAAALGVGPGLGNISWWSNSAGDVTTRACLFDDSIKFEANGNMTHYMNGSTWLEAWQGAPEGCGTPIAPHVGGAATYTYDAAAGTLTVNGLGAHIGLAKVINGSEIASPAAAASSITYDVAISNGGNTLTADINFGPGWWRFVYQRTVPIAVQDYNVTFRVDMSQYAGSLAGGMFVNGTFNGWCGTCNPMTDQGNGSWAVTLPLPPGAIEYKFTIDGWNAQEEFAGGESCTVSSGGFTNRAHTVTSDITLPNVCFASCDACTNDITFAVDMNDYVNGGGSTTAGVFLNGTFNGWCGTCTPMADANGDNVWDVTVPLTAGAIEYKFTVDGWNVSEQFVGGESCTVTNGGFTNRAYTVTTAATIGEVCWESCDDCTTGIEELNNTVTLYPNPVNTIMTVKATDAMQQIRILDLTGKVVATFVGNGLTQEINVESLKAGIYTIQIATAAGNSSKQFVKK